MFCAGRPDWSQDACEVFTTSPGSIRPCFPQICLLIPFNGARLFPCRETPGGRWRARSATGSSCLEWSAGATAARRRFDPAFTPKWPTTTDGSKRRRGCRPSLLGPCSLISDCQAEDTMWTAVLLFVLVLKDTAENILYLPWQIPWNDQSQQRIPPLTKSVHPRCNDQQTSLVPKISQTAC